MDFDPLIMSNRRTVDVKKVDRMGSYETCCASFAVDLLARTYLVPTRVNVSVLAESSTVPGLQNVLKSVWNVTF